MENIQSEQQTNKNMWVQHMKSLGYYQRCQHRGYRKKEKKKDFEKLFEEIMDENFPNLKKERNIQTGRTEGPNKDEPKQIDTEAYHN